ncbi:MAG: polysaccharide deacetylase family protein [Actinobacteria bacterium]|nr:polysaccharide deacetylase family protein [Actinomycetota bacterium]
MRRNRVIRFLIGAFAVGAFVGLVSGLAFGGGPGTPRAAVQSGNNSGNTSGPTTTSGEGQTASNEPMTPEMAKTIGANEMGQVLVVMYHLIGTPEAEWTRTPDNFRNDIAQLKAAGYYPINVRDLASGNIEIPAGKSPVVITFDDSSPGQYRILDDGSPDPDSAVGILQDAVKAGNWAPHASFFCLLDVTPKDKVLFGQPDRQQEKLKNLVDWGYEVGSHTVTHLNLKKASTQEAKKQLAQSQATLESLIGSGYQVTSLALPFGEYPAKDSLLKSGTYDGISYAYTAGLSLGASQPFSPFSTKFDPLHIPRIRGSANYLTDAIEYFKKHPDLKYISDGDPTTVSAPLHLNSKLGELKGDLGRPVVRY